MNTLQKIYEIEKQVILREVEYIKILTRNEETKLKRGVR